MTEDQTPLQRALDALAPTWRGHGRPIGRAQRLLRFAREQGVPVEAVEIAVNNSWSRPPRKARAYAHLGGTTYRYQVWALLD